MESFWNQTAQLTRRGVEYSVSLDHPAHFFSEGSSRGYDNMTQLIRTREKYYKARRVVWGIYIVSSWLH